MKEMAMSNENIYEACYKGYLFTVTEAIKSGYNINQKDNDGETILMASSLGGRYEIVSFLLENGAMINEVDNLGRTALAYCIIEYRDLDEGDKLSNAINSGITNPMLKTVEANSQKTIEILLEHGADINIADNDGNTPFHRLANKANLTDRKSLFSLLISKNGNLNKRNKSGKTPLEILENPFFPAGKDEIDFVKNKWKEKGMEIMQLGVEEKRKEKFFQALDYYERAKSYIPEELTLYISIAKTNHIIGKYDIAKKNYLEAAKINIRLAEKNLKIDQNFRQKVESQYLSGKSIDEVPKFLYHIVLLADIPRHLGHSVLNIKKDPALFNRENEETYRKSIIGNDSTTASILNMDLEQKIRLIGEEFIKNEIDWNSLGPTKPVVKIEKPIPEKPRASETKENSKSEKIKKRHDFLSSGICVSCDARTYEADTECPIDRSKYPAKYQTSKSEVKYEHRRSSNQSDCFVITATFNYSENELLINDFRSFRDNVLTKYETGNKFINVYKKYGPYAAEFIRDRNLLKECLKPFFIIFWKLFLRDRENKKID